ncbi:hypothetical protein DV517_61930 [Streptomyces sp. S816]|uniref:hypothetical protein n=1 Tax=Streptomyces sp. S816 TaxID=2283197 RepID=UPI00109C4888|nr:hypothetical protein [Streptomyces sp. S816]TGZ14710.1 hypothetical protein DV517_61930 [Streptomyces sp. S816]
MTTTSVRRGNCRVCGREYKLTRAGYLPKHWARDDNGNAAPGLPNCLGAGMDPARTPNGEQS